MAEKSIGIFGGSGVQSIEGIEDLKEVNVETPFGQPSAAPVVGRFKDLNVVFLPRHGKGHFILPSEINYRANIYAMKQLGVEWILSLSAVGSMKENIKPGDMVLVDQFIDLTKGRQNTFFGDTVVGHVSMADPICRETQAILASACEAAGATFHKDGTYVCIEGPQFSTRAESHLYRSWGVEVIGMTNMPEAKLAREAEISYATMAMATDYDCWFEGEEDVTAEGVLAVLQKNAETSKSVVKEFLKVMHTRLQDNPELTSFYAGSSQNAIINDRAVMSNEQKDKLKLLFGAYL